MVLRRLSTVLLGALLATAASTAAVAPAQAAPPDEFDRIVNGDPVTENYPFLVALSGCTGTLIKANWVVTADHCPVPATVRVGSVNRTSGGTVVRVTRAVSNPQIDVKLLQLASAVTHAPAPIPAAATPVGTATRIIGWGLTCPVRGCGSQPVVANQLDTSVVDDRLCIAIDGPREICTNNPRTDLGDAGACYGDSGGPQVLRVNGRWAVIGATSRAGNNNPRCATGPSIYGDLVSIRSWIVQTVGGGLPTP